MRTITTKNGTFNVDFAWAPTADDGCMIQYADNRRIPEIANDWDGLENVHFDDGTTGLSYDWDGYARLISIVALRGGKIQIELAKEAGNGAE